MTSISARGSVAGLREGRCASNLRSKQRCDQQPKCAGHSKSRYSLPRRFEPVSDSPNGFQVSRMLRVCLNFLSQPANVDIDGTLSNEWRFLPNSIQHLAPREHAT